MNQDKHENSIREMKIQNEKCQDLIIELQHATMEMEKLLDEMQQDRELKAGGRD